MPDSTHISTTVMFADICRSTYLFDRLGDDKAAALVSDMLRQAAAHVKTCNGEVLRTKGDDVLCIFEGSSDSLQAALLIHEAATGLALSADCEFSMRIGINTGDVILADGDLLGDTVNTAARLASLAKAGQTIASASTIDLLDHVTGGIVRPLGRLSLKGKSGPTEVFEFVAADQADEITEVGAAVQFPKSNRLSISCGSRVYELNFLLDRFLMGRAPDCDLVMDHPLVSRNHAEIRYLNNEFVLIDFSTNGTELIVNGRPRMVLRSQAALRGNGSIFLGRTMYNREFEIAFQASGGTRSLNQTNS